MATRPSRKKAKRFRVVAHVMHEEEQTKALETLESPELPAGGNAFVIGFATEAQIKELEKARIIVQPISEVDADGRDIGHAEPETPRRGAELRPEQRRAITYTTRQPQTGRRRPETLPDLSGLHTYLVQIHGPLLPQYSDDLKKAGATLIENFRNGFYSSVLNSDQASAVEQLTFVNKVILYDGERPSTIPAGEASFKLAFIDTWKTPNLNLRGTGDSKRWIVKVADATRPLRICLAYTDLPGRAVQNNLNLFVQGPSGTKFIGNHKLLHSLNIPDVDNNVEVVRIAAPQAGDYWIQVTAQNLLRNNQDFALVVTGALRTDKLTPR